MLIDHLTGRNLLFPAELNGWRDAIEQVAAPLLENGDITRDYVDAMLTSIAAGGTYIDLGFGIALAHARPEHGARRTAMSALWARPPILLNDDADHPISLIICLAASDSSGHLRAMRELSSILTDESARDALLAAHDPADATHALTLGGRP